MNKKFGVIVTGLSFTTLCAAASADPLPKSGSISLHSATRTAFEILPIADKLGQAHGDGRGVTFNDKGTGPLHLGPLDCTFASFITKDTGKNKGYCAFGDVDGDRLFTEFTGTFSLTDGHSQGMNDVVGGTGKYAGITGGGPWKCQAAGTNGETQCTHRIDYKMP